MSPHTPDPKCPDEAALEALRTGESDSEVAAHVARCASCRLAMELGTDLSDSLRLPEAIVPAGPDQALQTLLASGAARVRARRLRGRLVVGGLAAAASLLLVVGLSQLTSPVAPAAMASAELASVPVAGDLTRDGRLDVLDAFALARALESGVDPAIEWDFNGDGRVNDADVDALARDAVDLKRRS